MLVRDVEALLFSAFPAEDAEPWDRVGLSVGDPDAKVRGIACALDAMPLTVRQARDAGCNVLVTHHPAFLEPPAPVTPDPATSSLAAATLWEAVSLGVSLIAMHTNLDRSYDAVAMPGRLTSLETVGRLDADGYGALLRADGLTVDDVAARFGAGYGALPTVWGDGSAKAGLVGYASGSLGDIGAMAVDKGCTCVVGGELSYHRCLDLQARGAAVILLGHDVSELPYARLLAQRLAEEAVDVPVVTLAERARWHICLDAGPAGC